jgi:hypothetical protein
MRTLTKKERAELVKLGSEMESALQTLDRCANHALQIIDDNDNDTDQLIENVQDERANDCSPSDYLVWAAEKRIAIANIGEIAKQANLNQSEIIEAIK